MQSKIDGEWHKISHGNFTDNSTNHDGDHKPQTQSTDVKTNFIAHGPSKFTAILLSLTIMVTAINCCYILKGGNGTTSPQPIQYTPLKEYTQTFATPEWGTAAQPWLTNLTKYGIEPTIQIIQPEFALSSIESVSSFKVITTAEGDQHLYIYHNGDVLTVDSLGETKLYLSPARI